MALHINDPETDRLVRQLAVARGIGLTEAIRIAVASELRRVPLKEALQPLVDQARAAIAANPDPPIEDWKAFYDSLEGDDLNEPIGEPTARKPVR